MGGDGGPCCGFIRPEVRDNGREGGDELIAGGCKAEPCFKIGAGVEVVAQGAQVLLAFAGSVEDRDMRTVDLGLQLAQRYP